MYANCEMIINKASYKLFYINYTAITRLKRNKSNFINTLEDTLSQFFRGK